MTIAIFAIGISLTLVGLVMLARGYYSAFHDRVAAEYPQCRT